MVWGLAWGSPEPFRGSTRSKLFHNSINILFVIFIFILMIFSGVFQRLLEMWYYNRLNTDADKAIQLL